jgi:hypothetical protein
MPWGGIRTHDRSRRAAVDLRLRPRGYWDRQIYYLEDKILMACILITFPITFSKTEGMHHRSCRNSISPEFFQIFVFVRMKTNKHTFAVLSVSTSFIDNSIFKGDILILTDGTLVDRLVRVVTLLGRRMNRMIGT